MFFITDTVNKIIFGWSAKCACSHIKNIFWYLKNNTINNTIHIPKEYSSLPDDIENYITIIFIRNPFDRIISGFLDKYRENGEFRHLWKHNKITFSMFVNEVIKNDWTMIEKHHFTPQTSEEFNKLKIINSKIIKIYDIKNIDYSYIESLYNKIIPKEVLEFSYGNGRKKYNENYNEDVYDLDMSSYYQYNIFKSQFYNEEIKEKVYKFYENDFIFFKDFGFEYS